MKRNNVRSTSLCTILYRLSMMLMLLRFSKDTEECI